MFILSMAEMWLHNAVEHGWPNVTAAVLCGALLYQVAQPFLPDFKYEDLANDSAAHYSALGGHADDDEKAAVAAATAALLERTASGQIAHKERKASSAAVQRKGELDTTNMSKEAAQSVKSAKYVPYYSVCVVVSSITPSPFVLTYLLWGILFLFTGQPRSVVQNYSVSASLWPSP